MFFFQEPSSLTHSLTHSLTQPRSLLLHFPSPPSSTYCCIGKTQVSYTTLSSLPHCRSPSRSGVPYFATLFAYMCSKPVRSTSLLPETSGSEAHLPAYEGGAAAPTEFRCAGRVTATRHPAQPLPHSCVPVHVYIPYVPHVHAHHDV